MPVHTMFRDDTEADRANGLRLGHLSVELGHLYREDIQGGPERLREVFNRVVPWAATAKQACSLSLPPKVIPRISTCLLIDDYFTELPPPSQVIPMVLKAAEEFGLQVDYIARESGCVMAGDVDLTQLLMAQIVASPPRHTNGARPPVTETGWLSNGSRSPQPLVNAAMKARQPWAPPRQNGPNRHSIFVDVELWDEEDGSRVWACSLLAAIWQLMRLGLLRYRGAEVATPEVHQGPWPSQWTELPAVIQLSPKAQPFRAYRTHSILDSRFIETEHAVRTILEQIAPDRKAVEYSLKQASKEEIGLPGEIVRRIGYTFVE